MRTIVAKAKLIDNVQSIGHNSRTHTIIFDLPPSQGGTDTGPTALETSLIALADCAVTIYADIAKRSKIELTNLEAEAEAERVEGSPKITKVKVRIKVSGKASQNLLQTLWKKTEKLCPVFYLFKDPTPIETTLTTESIVE